MHEAKDAPDGCWGVQPGRELRPPVIRRGREAILPGFLSTLQTRVAVHHLDAPVDYRTQRAAEEAEGGQSEPRGGAPCPAPKRFSFALASAVRTHPCAPAYAAACTPACSCTYASVCALLYTHTCLHTPE